MIEWTRLRAWCRWEAPSLLWQTALLLVVWTYVVGLHASNDGLWYQGDSPRHAANGLFWRDFLSRLPVSPVEFAVSYYLRYPVISPTTYPPGFYLFEAATFSVFGASAYVAKGLVLAFTLAGGIYLMAWLRRWVAPEAGWVAPLLVLQPGVIAWSHAIMLNVPSMVMTLAALYHARRSIEEPHSRHLTFAIVMTALGILTYVQTAIVIPIVLTWLLMRRRWRSVMVLVGVTTVIAGGWAFVATRWSPIHVSLVSPDVQQLLTIEHWVFYARTLSKIASGSLLLLAVLGIAAAAVDRRWRREVLVSLSWFVIGYAALSYLVAKEPRYLLPLLPALICLGTTGVFGAVQMASNRRALRWAYTGMIALLAIHVWGATQVSVPKVDGFQDVLAFIQHEAPHEMVLYDGHYNGAFTFYVTAGDPGFQRGVVRGNKLFYPSAIDAGWHLVERVTSPADVVAILKKECGCRWLLIERAVHPENAGIRAAHYLREALRGQDFTYVRSFPLRVSINGSSPLHTEEIALDAYQLVGPAEESGDVRLHMPILGEGAYLQGKPIEP